MTFTVAIVGRPNVGKSTLFNRLVGKRIAIVDDTPGVTRDRREGMAAIGDLTFRVIDTAGLEEAGPDALEARMRAQTEKAIEDSDLVLLLIDARVGITPVDEHFAGWVRQHRKPAVLVANKCESGAADAGLYESYGLGLGDPVPVSAEHGEGMADLFGAVLPYVEAGTAETAEAAPDEAAPVEDEIDALEDGEAGETADTEAAHGPLRLAIVGRPNTGKSTLVNRLIGEERLLTGPEAGITRDSIAIDWEYRGRPLALVDTAGMRRRSRVVDKLEKLSVDDTLRTVRFANVVVLMLDATVMLEKQDLTIARLVIDEGRALIIAANKWDTVADPQAAMRSLRDRMQTSLPQVRGIPVVTISALRGQNLDKLMEAAFDIYAVWNRRVPTGELNRWLETMVEAHPPPLSSTGRRIRLRYITQLKTRPPTFAVWASRPQDLPEAYRRYLVNGLRDGFGIDGVPIRIQVRRGENPYAPKKKKR
jgi:GTP-binding protein